MKQVNKAFFEKVPKERLRKNTSQGKKSLVFEILKPKSFFTYWPVKQRGTNRVNSDMPTVAFGPKLILQRHVGCPQNNQIFFSV